MTPLLALLLRGAPPGPWRIAEFGPVQQRLAESFEYQVEVVAIDPGRGKRPMLEQVAERLQFPDWFGKNWDALNDVLADPDRQPELPRIIVLDPGGQVPDGTTAADLETLVAIFGQAAHQLQRCVLVVGPRPVSIPQLTLDAVGSQSPDLGDADGA